MPSLEAPVFDYEGVLTEMLESIIWPFKISGIHFMIWWNESYYTSEMYIEFYNLPSYNLKIERDRLYYVDKSPAEACESIIEPFRTKVEEVRRNADIPDTIQLGEN